MFHTSRWKRPTIASGIALSLLALVAALPSQAIAAGKTITAVMHSDLRIIDPGFTTAYITRDHGYMVYDTLLATDSNFKIQPQMAEWKVSDDKLTYTFTLRDGLKWHDGAPVTAEDCVASLKRWGRNDGMGQKLMDFTASLEATDDKTITLKLKEPYGLVLESIGKPSSLVPFMMPKRLAETPAGQQIKEQVGSGPFKFVQKDVLDALVGNPEYYKICGAVFVCGTPLESDVGAESLVKGNGMAEAKKLLAESGYDGTPVVIMAPGDVVTLKAQPVVAAQLLREAGFKVDLQATDWQTVVARRASQKPPKEGGWNMFFTNWVGADVSNPIANVSVGGRGTKGGWFGWAEDAKIEQMRDAFSRSSSPEEQKKIAADIQKENYEKVIYIPLGQYFAPVVTRKSLTGVLDGPATPIFWNIDKKE
jgi:peptide/nickel transport system substrate-binding protein